MSSATFTFAGAEVVATVSGALHVPAERTMIVADLHLEKASSLAQRGVLLPPYDSRATLAALARSMDRLKPRRVIYLGDSFHGPRGPERLAREDKEQIREWTATHEWIWIAGNHDAASVVELGGRVANEISMGLCCMTPCLPLFNGWARLKTIG